MGKMPMPRFYATVSGNLEFAVAKIFDAVAEFSGAFKFKSLGSFAHFHFKTVNRRFDLVFGVLLKLLKIQRDLEVIGFVGRDQGGLDRLYDGPRRYAVFAVKLFLNRAAPLRLFDRTTHRIGDAICVKNRLAIG